MKQNVSQNTGLMREDMVREFYKRMAGQQNLFKKATTKADIWVHASYLVSKILAKRMRPFSDGEMVKECLEAVADVAFPEKKAIISKMKALKNKHRNRLGGKRMQSSSRITTSQIEPDIE